jgi:acetyltransferase
MSFLTPAANAFNQDAVPLPEPAAGPWALRNGTAVVVRPIRAADEPLLARFHETLSEQSVYRRFLQALKLSQRVAHERLARRCHVEPGREIALVAQREGTGPNDLIAVARLVRLDGTNDAEFAVLVADAFQGQGLGTELLGRLLAAARAGGVRQVRGEILVENRAMQSVCERLGFALTYLAEDRLVRAELAL